MIRTVARTVKTIGLILALLLPASCAGLWIGSLLYVRGNPRGWTTPWNPYRPSGSGVSAWSNGRTLTVSFHRIGSQHPPTIQRRFAGFGINRSGWGDATGQLGSVLNLSASYRSLLVVTSLPLITLVVMRLTRRQPRPGCCTHCGYDLRATPERCPECGQVAAETAVNKHSPGR
jgi:hypothetical protein